MINPKVDHTYEDDNKILIKSFSGDVDIQFVIDSWKQDIEKGVVHEGLKAVLIVLLDANLLVDLNGLKEISAYFRKHSELFKSFKMAQVIDNPKIVFPSLFKLQNPEFDSQVFTTVDAALEWV